MFFSGDSGSRRKVELRGRSNKESDRQVLLNKAKDERERRQQLRMRHTSALRIQKCFRGRRDIAAKKQLVRQEFIDKFGEHSERAGHDALKPNSKYLPEMFYFVSPSKLADVAPLVGACRLLSQCVRENGGNLLAVFTNGEYSADRGAINYRVKRLAGLCLRALHGNRMELKDQLLSGLPSSNSSVVYLVETVIMLARIDLPWGGVVVEHLAQSKMFHLLRELVLIADINDLAAGSRNMSSLERLVHHICLLYVKGSEYLKHVPLSWTFSAQIFSVPLLWQRLPLLKLVTVTEGVWAYAVHQAAAKLMQLRSSFPQDVSSQYPSAICFLCNILEASALALARPDCTTELIADFANVGSYFISCLPSSYLFSQHAEEEDDSDEMMTDQLMAEPALLSQLKCASNPDILKEMLSRGFLSSASKAAPVGAICGYLYAVLSLEQRTTALTCLAYTARLIPPLWQYIKACHVERNWPSIEIPTGESRENLPPPEVSAWILPLAVFCPVFSYLLYSMDNEEFYGSLQPIQLDDGVQLVHVLKEALWQVLWVLPFKTSASIDIFSFARMRESFITAGARLLAELHDRNSKRQFVPFNAFHARETFDENFFHQAEAGNTRAAELLKHAPFLIPFTSRVRVYTAQVAAARHEHSQHPFGRVRIRVQRDRIVEDSFGQLSTLKEDDLKGTIRVTFINELGLEEAGVDGGGLFKDFMETITRMAFDVQYGLFKETADHLLYPNPASHVVHDNHLEYFEFLGKILGKAMFEGILVDIPFATFFLSKLKKKQNFLNDLPSLDPMLYKNLLFLKNNPEMFPQLGIYFVIADDQYGEQLEVELLPGGKDIQVTAENVFRYIHLVANHRLNTQIRQQSNAFLRGFQQLISPEWIDMFSEHELQVLISGSQEGIDIDDLRKNVNYVGGYEEDHPTIEMFWDIVKTFDVSMQRKLLKFVTGCSRGPLLGFKYLEPQFAIQKTAPEDASDEMLDRLPSSATCMNLLKLPPYKSKNVVREKLLYAITADAGFDLS